jgi:hypothetical protein
MITKVLILIGTVITTLMLETQLRSEPLESYCLSEVSQRRKVSPNLLVDAPVQITIPANDGEPFHLLVSGSDRLLLTRGEDQTPLSQVSARQYEYGTIKDLIFSQDGWLWIDGEETDYIALLELGKRFPKIGEPKPLPELYSKPCSYWGRWWGNCLRAQGYYSHTLDRVLITGHRVSLWGRPSLVSFELMGEKTKLLPAEVQDAHLVVEGTQRDQVVELSRLGGVLFRGISGEAIFYDGVNFTMLLDKFSASSSNKELSRWDLVKTADERIFLTNIGTDAEQELFLIEVEPGPVIKSIKVLEGFENPVSVPQFFTFPNDPRIWVVSKQNILVETEIGLMTVAVTPEPSFINAESVWQLPDGHINFMIHNPVTKSSNYYSLAPSSSSTEKCIGRFSPNKLISIF